MSPTKIALLAASVAAVVAFAVGRMTGGPSLTPEQECNAATAELEAAVQELASARSRVEVARRRCEEQIPGGKRSDGLLRPADGTDPEPFRQAVARCGARFPIVVPYWRFYDEAWREVSPSRATATQVKAHLAHYRESEPRVVERTEGMSDERFGAEEERARAEWNAYQSSPELQALLAAADDHWEACKAVRP